MFKHLGNVDYLTAEYYIVYLFGLDHRING